MIASWLLQPFHIFIRKILIVYQGMLIQHQMTFSIGVWIILH